MLLSRFQFHVNDSFIKQKIQPSLTTLTFYLRSEDPKEMAGKKKEDNKKGDAGKGKDGKGKDAKGKGGGGGDDKKEKGGSSKGAQSINVRHILVSVTVK